MIEDVRTTIFDLHRDSDDVVGSLSSRIRSAVAELTAGAGMAVGVRSSGPLSAVDPITADHVLAVVREGVSNAVRHSGGDRGTVSISVSEAVRVIISDNGNGGVASPSADRGHHGLRNMRARAADVGGSLTVERPAEGGTRIVWTAPLV